MGIPDFRRFEVYAQFLKVRHKTQRRLISFHPRNWYPAQRALHQTIEAIRNRGQPVWILLLKARQEGCSSYTTARIFHATATQRNTNSLILADKKDRAEYIFEMCKTFYDHLPEVLKPTRKYSNKKELVFDNKEGTGLKSGIYIATALDQFAGMGMTLHNVHVCLHPDQEVWKDNLLRPIREIGIPTLDWNEDLIRVHVWLNSSPITGTPDHRVWVYPGRWKQLKDLTKDDYIASPRPQITEELKEIRVGAKIGKNQFVHYVKEAILPTGYSLGYIIGLFLADGNYVGYPNYRITFSLNAKKDGQVLKKLQEHLSKIGIKKHRENYYRKDVLAEYRVMTKGNVTCVLICSKLFGEFLSQFYHNGHKYCPLWIFKCGRKFLQGLLKGYFAGDGYFANTQSKMVSASSTSPHLAYAIRDVIAALDYGYPSVRRFTNKWGTPSWAVVANGKCSRHLARIVTGRYVSKAEREERVQKYIEEKDYIYCKVKKVEKVSYTGPVYDLLDQPNGRYRTPAGIVSNSEASAFPYLGLVLTTLLPAIPPTSDTIVIVETTAKGAGTEFHEEWQKAKAGQSVFVPVFFPWFIHPEYRMRPPEEELRRGKLVLTEEERKLVKQFHLDDEQIYWRRYMIKQVYREDEESFAQEYPATDEEAFIVAGNCYFDKARLKEALVNCTDPRKQLEVETALRSPYDLAYRLREHERGRLWVWHEPQKGHRYRMGVDVAEGKGQDYSAIEVFDETIMEQAAEWMDNTVDPISFARIVVAIAKWYSNATVAIEINGPGLATQNEAKRFYYNFYFHQYIDRFTNRRTDKLGWLTTPTFKRYLLSYMEHVIDHGVWKLNSSRLVGQLMTYIHSGDLAEAAPGCFDDLVMACMIALYTAYQDGTIFWDKQEATGERIIDQKRDILDLSPPPDYDSWWQEKEQEEHWLAL